MKKFHLQAQVSIINLAEVAKAMHKKGLRLIKPPDIVRFCLQTVHSILNAEQLTEEEAMKFLRDAGYFSLKEAELVKSIIGRAVSKQAAHEEIENLIEEVKRSPTSIDEIKKMFSESIKGVDEECSLKD